MVTEIKYTVDIMPPDKSVYYLNIFFSYFSNKTYIVGSQKNQPEIHVKTDVKENNYNVLSIHNIHFH